MKHPICLSVLLVFSALYIQAQEITVATFNAEFLNKSRVHIKYGLSFDISKEPKKEQKFWSKEENRTAKLQEASAKVAKVIKQLNADVLTLTEVGDSADIAILVEELKKLELNYKYQQVCDCKDRFTQQHVAVLSKYPIKDVWTEIPGRSIYLEELDGDTEDDTGISKGLKVTLQIQNKEIDLFVLHLKSERGGFDSDAKRIAQASIARRSIIKLLNEGRNVIVTGDLNAEKGSPTLYRLRGFDDIYEELIQTGDSRYFENTDIRWTYKYKGETEQIDHILISQSLSERNKIKTSIIEVTDQFISDHNPVIVSLQLK